MAALLTIPQVFALLQIAPDGRARATVTRTQLGTAGGVLADLTLRGAIALSKDRVVIASGTPTGDQVLDTALAWIASESPKPAKWWVRQLGKRTLHDGVVAQLVQRGVLTEEQHRTLLVFTTTRHPERDGLPRAQVRQAVDEVWPVEQPRPRTSPRSSAYSTPRTRSARSSVGSTSVSSARSCRATGSRPRSDGCSPTSTHRRP